MIFEMVVGCTGSGKNTYARQRQIADWARISFIYTKASMKKSFEKVSDKEVIFEMLQRAKDFLRAGRCVVFEGTFLTAQERIEILNSIKETFGKKAYYYLVFMDLPENECILRNNLRHGKVSEEEIHSEFAKLEKPTYMEGWDIIKTIGITK